ncbi:MAG: hypothetical protein ABFC63_08200 [Thermoguttaceae bacterium]
MATEGRTAAFAQAVHEFNTRTRRSDGEAVATSLKDGLVLLQELLYSRLHGDVQRNVGKDSMLVPISELKTQLQVRTETALFEIVESRAAAAAMNAIGPADDWYLQWLGHLLLGEALLDANALERLVEYGPKSPQRRLLTFTDVLAHVLPESRQAPLILFTLFPLSVQIATVAAFGDVARAGQLRHQQLEQQPAIEDCSVCKGRPLKVGKQCPKCGNPLWKHEWLVVI